MSETIKDQETSSEQGNPGRRRLVRGAAALAPVVLTLRSGGALAAASCTGAAKYLGVQLEGGGKIPDGLTVDSTDVCYTTVTACEGNAEKLSTDTNSYTRLGPVTQSGSSSNYICENGAIGQKVAILSSQSAGSLV